jgi:hypothetical protein
MYFRRKHRGRKMPLIRKQDKMKTGKHLGILLMGASLRDEECLN